MKHKVILVLLDGLNYEVARHALGHLHAYCAAGRAALYRLECELPALSRPLYECIMTGVAPIDSGVVHNDVVRLSIGLEDPADLLEDLARALKAAAKVK